MNIKSEINQSTTHNNDSVDDLNQNIFKPKYDRALLSSGIIHIGVGNFHRAHQAYYINEYLNNYNDLNWGIVGVNLRKSESDNFQSLINRKGKYILKTISTKGEKKYNEIHSITELYDWSKDSQKAESIFGNPNLEIVTMTVTETGYYISENNELNLDLPIVKNNIAGEEKSIIYSYLYNALKIRKEECNKPITLLCCDNIRENGVMLKNTLLTYVKASNDIELLNWIIENVSFPSCVVDRITPRAPDNLAEEINDKFNIKEGCSVMAEPFIQWVIEDKFIGKRPALEKIGVQFIDNVFPYEEAKIRILNGGHLMLSYLGVMQGLQTYDQVINHKELQKFFFNLEKKEIIPALGNDIPFDLDDYLLVIFDRFKNEYIADKLERLTMDGSGKFPIFVLPTIRVCFKKGITPQHCIESIASWYAFMFKIHKGELKFDYYEPRWKWICLFLHHEKIDDFINCKELWGTVPSTYPEFKSILKKEILKFKL